MTIRQETIVVAVAAMLLIATSSEILAQQRRAMNRPPKATLPAAEPVTPAEPVQPVLESSPAVRFALEMPRKTPRDYVQSILLLVDLGRPELAKPILAELMKLNVTDAQRVAIVNEFGSQGMLHLSRAKELAPAAGSFADACMAAANAAATNPERIAALVKQLSDPSPEVRMVARNDLAATGQAGATAALEALARESDPQRRAAIAAAVELMHPLVDRPLLAMLETRDPQLRAEVAALLEQLKVPQAAPLLAGDAVSAERAVATALSNYQHGTPPFAVDSANQVELWKWNDAAMKLSSLRVPADKAQLIRIASLAGELARLRPDSYDDQRRALVLRLEAAGITGSSPTASANLQQADLPMLSDALADALKHNYPHAALALVEALTGRGDTSILITADGKPSPLADALASPNRRVRFAALKAIMALNPATPYPGSSRVPDALVWFANATGEPQAIVAMPTITVAGDLAGQLAAHQIAAEATNNGRDVVELARAMPDLELVLIDMNVIEPNARETVYELRISPTTGDVPIALLAADGRLDAAQRLAADHTRIIAIPRPHTPAALTSLVDELKKLAARDQVSADERIAEAEQAKKWLAVLSSGNRPFYTFRRTAMSQMRRGVAGVERSEPPVRRSGESPNGSTPTTRSPRATRAPSPETIPNP